jgi:hypothetical protein
VLFGNLTRASPGRNDGGALRSRQAVQPASSTATHLVHTIRPDPPRSPASPTRRHYSTGLKMRANLIASSTVSAAGALFLPCPRGRVHRQRQSAAPPTSSALRSRATMHGFPAASSCGALRHFPAILATAIRLSQSSRTLNSNIECVHVDKDTAAATISASSPG